MLERTLVKSLGWPEGRLLVLAHEAGTRLAEMGLSGEAILVWLDQVYAEPEKFVNDPALSRLALALLCQHHEKDVNRASPCQKHDQQVEYSNEGVGDTRTQ